MKLKDLQKKYPKFIYESYSYGISRNDLEIVFSFRTVSANGKNIAFKPEIIVKNIDKKRMGEIKKQVLDNLIFNIGMIEIPSYWKATCSPIIEVRAGYLDKEHLRWWQNLIIKGLGQFFYENKINFKNPKLLKIINGTETVLPKTLNIQGFFNKGKDGYLVPFAGGRDSIVTLEKLKQKKKDISLFTVNPIDKIQKVVKVSGIKKQIIVRRKIDRKLLELNKKGYLNGHTPFTSVLSFISVLCAVLFGYKNIAFSNEKSADDGNVKYLGKTINHQWAKSSEFEKMFQIYAKKYLVKDINYFSYLRRYSELEISKMLASYKKYLPVFSSCNAGMRIGPKGTLSAKKKWCGKCPKCLFVYLSLTPYLSEKEMKKVFNKDLFGDKTLLSLMKNLIGERGFKPFECVGTKKESLTAFYLALKKYEDKNLPFLIKYFKEKVLPKYPGLNKI